MGQITRKLQGRSKSINLYYDSAKDTYYYEYYKLRDSSGGESSFTLNSKQKITSIQINFPEFFGLTKHTYDININFDIYLEKTNGEKVKIFDSVSQVMKKATVKSRDDEGKPLTYTINYVDLISFFNNNYNENFSGTYDKLYIYNTTTYSVTQKNGTPEGEIIINYEEISDEPPSTPSFITSNQTIESGSDIQIEWSSSSNGDSDFISYDLYRNNIKIQEQITSTYYIEQELPAGIYTYQVQAIGKNNNGTLTGLNSNKSTSITITSEYASAPIPQNLFFTIDDKSISKKEIYIGAQGISQIKLSWDHIIEKDDNPFQSYRVYKDGTNLYMNLTTPECILIYPYNGEYTVQTICENNSSEHSASIKIKLIDKPETPVINSFIDNEIYQNVEVTWQNIPSIENSNISYETLLTVNNVKKVWIPTNETFYLVELINNSIYPNDFFKISIRAKATAIDGGYTYSDSYNSSNIVYVSPLNPPETLWQYCYGVDKNGEDIQNKGLYPWGYQYCKLSWNKFESNIDDDNISYIINMRINANGSWQSLVETYNTESVINLNNIAEGSVVYFQLTAKGKYSNYPDNRIHSYTIHSKPNIQNILISNVSRNSLQVNFKWENGDFSEADLIYKIFLGYGQDEELYFITSPFKYDSNKNIQQEIKFSINADGNQMIKKLYQDVVGDIERGILGRVYPEGFIRIEIYNAVFHSCINSIKKTFKFNFLGELSKPKNFKLINENIGLINPQQEFSYTFDSSKWVDPLGNDTNQVAGKIKYIIEGNNKIREYQKAGIYNDIVLTSLNDQTLTYTLKAQVTYADYILTSPIETLNVKIARWSSQDNISLRDVKREKENDGYKISGKLLLPSYLCGSKIDYASNVKTVKCYLNSTNFLNKKEIPFDKSEYDISQEIIVNFDFFETKENINFYGEVEFINTNPDETKNKIIKLTSSYEFRPEGVPLAIRKGRVGINVNSSIFTNNNQDENSALCIMANENSGSNTPVVNIFANSVDNPKFLSFIQNGTEIGSFYYDSNKKHFFANNFYFPFSVNNQTPNDEGNIFLSASDIGALAKPENWEDGDGILRFDNTFLNSNSSLDKGKIGYINFNGEKKSIKVYGLGSMAYEANTNYLPKKAIIYSLDEPTEAKDLVAGNIWLKPIE